MKFTTCEIFLLFVVTSTIFAVITLSFNFIQVLPDTGNMSTNYLEYKLKGFFKRKFNIKRSIEECDCTSECENTSPIPIEEKLIVSKPEIFAKTIYEYPYLVSLSVPLWNDAISNESLLYQCAGVIINKNTVLTSKCVNDDEWFVATVRSGSDMWSYGGSTHSVISTEAYNDNVAIKVAPKFDHDTFSFTISNSNAWKVAKLIGWQVTDKKLSKYKRFDVQVVDISKALCANCSFESICKCDKRQQGLVLSYNGSFIIINADGDCYSKFISY